MFVVVTVAAGWLGWELKFVRERLTLREGIVDRGGSCDVRSGMLRPMPGDEPAVPFWRRWLGDDATWDITLNVDSPFTPQEIEHVRRVFPEALVVAMPKDLQ